MSIPKKHRLQKSTFFQKIFKKGYKKVTPFFIAYAYKPSETERSHLKSTLPSFGIVASKKIGGAVKRNRAKRLIREAVKQNWDIIKDNQSTFIFVCRSTILDTKIEKLSETVKQLFAQ